MSDCHCPQCETPEDYDVEDAARSAIEHWKGFHRSLVDALGLEVVETSVTLSKVRDLQAENERLRARVAKFESGDIPEALEFWEGRHDLISTNTELRRQLAAARAEAFGLAARQCKRFYGDEGGSPRCRYEDVTTLADELTSAVDCEAEDVGGHRPTNEILKDLGRAIDNAARAHNEGEDHDPTR